VRQRDIEANLAILDHAGFSLNHPTEVDKLHTLPFGFHGDFTARVIGKGAVLAGQEARSPQALERSCLSAAEEVALEHAEVDLELFTRWWLVTPCRGVAADKNRRGEGEHDRPSHSGPPFTETELTNGRSGSRGALLLPRPLRTVRETCAS